MIKNWFRKVKLINLDSKIIKKALPKIDYKNKKINGVIHLSNPAQYFLLDKNYKSCNISDFKKLLEKDFTNWKIAHKNYDCDNFAFKLCSNLKSKYPMLAVGIVISTNHAFNVFVDNNGIAWYIEPQDDKIYSYRNRLKSMKDFMLVLI